MIGVQIKSTGFVPDKAANEEFQKPKHNWPRVDSNDILKRVFERESREALAKTNAQEQQYMKSIKESA